MDASKRNASLGSGAAAIAAIIGLVIGVVVGIAVKGTRTQTAPDPAALEAAKKQGARDAILNTSSRAINFRVALNGLGHEHVALTATVLKEIYDNRVDAPAAALALNTNSRAIAAELGKSYGEDVRKQFFDAWTGHISSLSDYARALKSGNRNDLDKAITSLNGSGDALADFLVTTNSYLDQTTIKGLVTEHVALLRSVVDSYAAKNYDGSFTKEHDAGEQFGRFADAIVDASIRQFPDFFSQQAL